MGPFHLRLWQSPFPLLRPCQGLPNQQQPGRHHSPPRRHHRPPSCLVLGPGVPHHTGCRCHPCPHGLPGGQVLHQRLHPCPSHVEEHPFCELSLCLTTSRVR